MTGAIEFLKAWRDICCENVSKSCDECPVMQECADKVIPRYSSEKEITELVRSVMAQKRNVKDVN